MSSWRARERALTGPDCFMRAFDLEAHRFHGAGHVSQLALRLGAGFDGEAFRALLAEVARATPVLRAPIGRRFGLGPPAYRLRQAARAPLPCIALHDDDRARAADL